MILPNVTSLATTGTNTLALAGSNTVSSFITGVIGDGTAGGKVAVTKTGASTWTLQGTNTYTGTTTLTAGTASAGIVIAANRNALGANAAPLDLDGSTLNLAVGTNTATGIAPYNASITASSIVQSDAGTAGTPGFTHQFGTLSGGTFTLTASAGAM